MKFLLRSSLIPLLLLLNVECGTGKSVVDYVQANLSSSWNEDLEPVLSAIATEARRVLFPYVQDVFSDENVSTDCTHALLKTLIGLRNRKLWAFKLLDSAGGLPSNIFDGTLSSFGGYDECLSIRVHDEEDINEVNFVGKYCTVAVHIDRQPMLYRVLPDMLLQEPLVSHYLGTNLTWALELMEKLPLGLRCGLCIPSTCEDSVLSHLADKFGGKYGIRLETVACRDDLTPIPIHPATWISGFVVGLAAILVVCSTIVDLHLPPGYSPGLPMQVLMCFSARASYQKLSASRGAQENLDMDCVHGIRVISSLWILFSHTYLGDPGLYDRALHFLEALRGPAFSIVTQGMLAVDTFFVLTGMLMYRKLYAVMKKDRILEKVSLSKFVCSVILRRALRLAVPAMAVLCLFYLLPLITSGPGMDAFYPYFRENCDRRWWAALLFINNFWTVDKACLGNQWYNAADMQNLVILIFPTILAVRRPRLGFAVIALSAVFSAGYTAFLTVYYDAVPTALAVPRQILAILQFSLHISDQALPYLGTVCIGVLGGSLIETYKGRKISSLAMKVGWLVSGTTSFAVVFVVSVWHRRGSVTSTESIIYAVLYRPLWGACVMWVVFACASGRSPVVRWLLNRPGLMVFSRLSYSFYLSQYLVIMVKNFTARYKNAFTYYQNSRDFFADMVYNYILAFFIYILFEAPTYAVDRLSLKSAEQALQAQSTGNKKNDNEKANQDVYLKNYLNSPMVITHKL